MQPKTSLGITAGHSCIHAGLLASAVLATMSTKSVEASSVDSNLLTINGGHQSGHVDPVTKIAAGAKSSVATLTALPATTNFAAYDFNGTNGVHITGVEDTLPNVPNGDGIDGGHGKATFKAGNGGHQPQARPTVIGGAKAANVQGSTAARYAKKMLKVAGDIYDSACDFAACSVPLGIPSNSGWRGAVVH